MPALNLALLLLCTSPPPTAAVETPTQPTHSSRSPWRVAGGYYGDVITHPGGYVGGSWIAADVRPFSFSLGADAGAYHHARNHSALFVRANFATRVTSKVGLLIEPRFVLGYAHSWVAGDDHFLVDEAGILRQTNPSGDPNLIYGIGVGFGYEIQRGRAAGLGFVVRPEVLGRYPYNDFALTQFALLVGIEWRFGKRGAR